MAVFLGLTLFTFQTKIDFSFLVRDRRRRRARLEPNVASGMGLLVETGPFSLTLDTPQHNCCRGRPHLLNLVLFVEKSRVQL